MFNTFQNILITKKYKYLLSKRFMTIKINHISEVTKL